MRLRFAAVVALGALQCVHALDPTVSLSQYARRHWQVEDGLPQNYVTSISQSRDGYLLVGTAGGAARFDGLRFTPLVLDEQNGRSREWITAVQAGRDAATVWIATRDAGFYELGRRRWPLRFDNLMLDRAGEPVGLGTGLWRRDAGELRQIQRDISPADPSWSGLLELPARAGTLVAAGQGLFLFPPAGPRVLLLKPDAPEGRPLALAEARRSRAVWVGTSRGLFHARPGPRGIGMKPVDGLPGPVVSVVEDSDGVVWAGTWGLGLWRVVGGKAEAFTARDGLEDNFVHAVFEDREGNLWIGTRAGLSRWKSTPIVPFGLTEGANGQFFSTVSGDASGAVWLGTWRSGLYRLQGAGAPERVPLPQQDLGVLVRSTATAPDGSLWLSDWRALYHRTGAGWKELETAALGYRPQVHALLFDREGRMWVGAESGLYVHAATVEKGAPRIEGQSVRTLLEDSRGRMWAGGPGGLWRIEANSFVAVSGLPDRTVTSISEDSEGRIWATTRANGLVLITDAGVRVFDQRNGLPALPLYAAVDDGRGSLWLSSPAGIFEVQLPLLDDLVTGKRDRIPVLTYGQDDGMRTIECQNVGYPSAWKDTGGDLWFPTVRGAVRVRPWRRRIPDPPAVLIEGAVSERQSHSVRFTAARLGAPSRVEFRYRIVGAQSEWTALGAERTLRFDALPAGTHQVLIAAREQGGEWGEPASVSLTQLPRWHETWWFRLLALALAAGGLVLIYRWRMLIVRGRYAAVLAERNRISGEWHDTLLAGFSAISWQLDATLRRLREKPETAAETVEVARTMVQHYKAEARRVIWDLRHDSPEGLSMSSAISGALREMTDQRGIEWKLDVEGAVRPVPGEVAQNLLRICQEAASNAIRHAAPTRVDVTLKYASETVAMTVRDDGRGFDPGAVPPGHFGLQIMQERARRFGGDVEVVSHAGVGTTVTAAIPLTAAAAGASHE